MEETYDIHLQYLTKFPEMQIICYIVIFLKHIKINLKFFEVFDEPESPTIIFLGTIGRI